MRINAYINNMTDFPLFPGQKQKNKSTVPWHFLVLQLLWPNRAAIHTGHRTTDKIPININRKIATTVVSIYFKLVSNPIWFRICKWFYQYREHKHFSISWWENDLFHNLLSSRWRVPCLSKHEQGSYILNKLLVIHVSRKQLLTSNKFFTSGSESESVSHSRASHCFIWRTRSCNGITLKQFLHSAFGMTENSGASEWRGARSNSSCKGTMYSMVFPPPEALLIVLPLYPSDSGGTTDKCRLPFPPVEKLEK